MSRNFDVLSRAGRESEIFEPLTVEPEAVGIEPSYPPVHIDRAVQEEEMRMVQRVFFLDDPSAPRVVLFSGIEEPAGSVGICARAGQNLAEHAGVPVCLVEGNLEAPSLHKYFGVKNICGVADAIFNPKPVREFLRQLDRTNLHLLSAGSAGRDIGTAWKSERWRSCLAELRREFQFVLISGPAAIRQLDMLVLGQMTDGVILVLESNQTRRETARTVKQTLCAGNVKVLGAVLNNRTFPIPESIYRKL